MRFELSKPKAETTTIRIAIDFGKIQLKYSTGRKIRPEHWDNKRRRPKTNQRGEVGQRNKELNVILSHYEMAVTKIVTMYGNSLTRTILKDKLDEYFHKKKEETLVSVLFKEYLEEIKSLNHLTPATQEKYTKIFDKWLHFERKRKYHLTDLTDNLLTKFVAFLRNEYKLTDNTLHRNLNYFKTFINWNKRKKRQVPEDYKQVKVTVREAEHPALTENDLKVLEELELPQRLDYYRDLFLIGCYSGQRYSDYSVFEKADVVGDFIIKRAEKTETYSRIPLHTKLKALLDKYDWTLKKISSQKFNKAIQEICKRAGFNEEFKKTVYYGSSKQVEVYPRYLLVASHTARRTFITISSEKGMPDHIIMAITGIKDPKTLKKYKKINAESVFNYASTVWS